MMNAAVQFRDDRLVELRHEMRDVTQQLSRLAKMVESTLSLKSSDVELAAVCLSGLGGNNDDTSLTTLTHTDIDHTLLALREAKESGADKSLHLPGLDELRREVGARKWRLKDMDQGLFAEPAWDMMLDLAIAHREGRQISVSSLCIASGVPETTALRLIQRMVDQGWFERDRDLVDKRRSYIQLSDQAKVALARYFDKIRSDTDGSQLQNI
ncbi:MAG: hypothetical protein ACK5NN_11185 [Sphingomonadaceae bacterium]